LQRRHATKPFHLLDRKIADSDGADLSLPIQLIHSLGSFCDVHQRVRPVDLVDVDIVGSQPPQRVLNLGKNPPACRVANDFSAAPFKSDFRCNVYLAAQVAFGDRLADDFFRTTEPVRRRCINQVDAIISGGLSVAMDCASSVPPHIQPPMAQVPRATRDTFNEVSAMAANSISSSRALD
jgi:hypothetical protein